MSADTVRRKFCQSAGVTILLAPFAAVSGRTYAATNAALRAELKYQDTPAGNMTCSACLEFLPGKSANARGGCKLIPGDDEISPNGYCVRWNTM